MVSTCKDCGQEFLSSSEYKCHQQTHLKTHIDSWSKPDKVNWKPPDGMTQDLMVFEKYRLGERAMLCLWVNNQLKTAIREPIAYSRIAGKVAGASMTRSQQSHDDVCIMLLADLI